MKQEQVGYILIIQQRKQITWHVKKNADLLYAFSMIV